MTVHKALKKLVRERMARTGESYTTARRHVLAKAGRAEAPPPPADLDLAAAVLDAIGHTVAHLTGPVLGNNFDVNFGFSGMAKLAAQLRDTRAKTAWARRFGEPVPFYHGVRRLYECVELEYTAPGGTRPVYARFLRDAAGILPDKASDLTAAAELFDESGARWSRLAARALESADALGEYAQLAERRMALMLSKGQAARDEIRQLTVEVDKLAAAYTVADTLGAAGRRELFDELAGLVDECLALERRAVELLR